MLVQAATRLQSMSEVEQVWAAYSKSAITTSDRPLFSTRRKLSDTPEHIGKALSTKISSWLPY